MKKIDLAAIKVELDSIRAANDDGLLQTADVIRFAENTETALHAAFEWDDGKAAHQYRIEQARAIIQQVYVRVEQGSSVKVHRAFVSLVTDRGNPGGGYRPLEDVVATPVFLQTYLTQALQEAQFWRQKYESIAELRPVFEALDAVEASTALASIGGPFAKPAQQKAAVV